MSVSRMLQQDQRRRLKEEGTTFPLEYVDKIKTFHSDSSSSSPSSTLVKKVTEALLQLTQAGNTYAEISALKKVWVHFDALVKTVDVDTKQDGDAEGEKGIALLLEHILQIVFFENSKGLHKQLLSKVVKLDSRYFEVCERVLLAEIEARCRQETVAAASAFSLDDADLGLEKCRQVMEVSKGLMSMLTYPRFDGLFRVGDCCALLVTKLSSALQTVCSSPSSSSNSKQRVISPEYAKLCQDTASAIYSLVQRFLAKLQEQEDCIVHMLRACLDVLHTESLPRDVLITLSVTLWTYMFHESTGRSDVEPNDALHALWAANTLFLTRNRNRNRNRNENENENQFNLIGAKQNPLQLKEPSQQSASTSTSTSMSKSDQPTFLPILQVQGASGSGHKGQVEMERMESPVHKRLRPRGILFDEELASLSECGLLSCLRGLLSVLSPSSYGVILQVNTESQSNHDGSDDATMMGRSEKGGWSVMLDGILPAVMASVKGASDSHTKYHALCILEIALQHWQKYLADIEKGETGWRGGDGKDKEEEEEDNDEIGYGLFDEDGDEKEVEEVEQEDIVSAAAGTPPLAVQSLEDRHLMDLVDLLSSSWEDPLVQVAKVAQFCFGYIVEIHELQSHILKKDSQKFIFTLCRKLLAMGFYRKGIYTALTYVVEKIGARRLLDIEPNLVKETIDTTKGSSALVASSSFLKAFLHSLYLDSPSTAAWRETWQEDFISGLLSTDPAARQSIALYTLPIPLEIDSSSFDSILRSLLEGLSDFWSMEQVAAVVVILKRAKELDLVGNLDTTVKCPGGYTLEIDPKIFECAIFSSQEAVRIDMLELLCASKNQKVLPGNLELELLRLAIPLNLSLGIGSFKQRFEVLMTKLFKRMHVGIRAMKHTHSLDMKHKDSLDTKRGYKGKGDLVLNNELIDCCTKFLSWLRNYLVSCLYPGAPCERKRLSMSLLRILLGVFLNPQTTAEEDETVYETFSPLQEGPLLSSGYVQTLISNITDSWDDIRNSASDILCQLPSPLAGLSTEEDLKVALEFAKELLLSAPVRECDAGASLIRTLVKRYVFEMGWKITIHPTIEIKKPAIESQVPTPGITSTEDHTLELFASVLELAGDCLQHGENNLYEACLSGLAHGGLLLLRYLLEDIYQAKILQCRSTNVELMRKIFPFILKATQVSVWAVSQQDELNVQASEAEQADLSDLSSAPQSQVIMSGTWLTMKEVSMTTGVMAQILMCSKHPRRENDDMCSARTKEIIVALMERMGDNLIRILEEVKHQGSTVKSHLALIVLVEQLLASSSSAFNRLPYKWLDRLKVFVERPGQTRSDIVRRSAGLPFALMALVKAEPRFVPRKLLSVGMNIFMNIASSKDDKYDSCFPRVHAFNMLWKVFNDSDLATSTSGFFADGMKLAIIGFGDANWEVRNAASQMFTALVIRMVGFRNVLTRQAARRPITSKEFFDRFQALHSFFISELDAAVRELESRDKEQDYAIVPATMVHPSLLPILVILSRLDCSFDNKHTALLCNLSPKHLAPYVQRCCVAHSLALRNLAAASLSPLVAPDEVADVLKEIDQKVRMDIGLITNMDVVNLSNGAPHRCSFNMLHGRLRQARVLIERNARMLSDANQPPLIHAMTSMLATLIQCSSYTNPCPYVRAEAVTIICSVFSFLSTLDVCKLSEKEANELVHQTTTLLTASAEKFTLGGGEYSWQIGIARLSVALLRFFSQYLGRQEEKAKKVFQVSLACLSSQHYEVRAAVLKEMLQNWEILVEYGFHHSSLFPQLYRMLQCESHHKPLKHVFSLLAKCSQSMTEGQGQNHKEWIEIAALCLSMAHTCKHEELKSAALACSGFYTNRVMKNMEKLNSSSLMSMSDFADILLSLVQLADHFSEAWQRSPLRFSAYSCLFESGLFSELSSWMDGSGSVAVNKLTASDCRECLEFSNLKLWQVAIDQLQDQDEDIRQCIGQILGMHFYRQQKAGDVGDHFIPHDMQTTLILEESFAYLTSVYTAEERYHAYLLDSIESSYDSSTLLTQNKNAYMKQLFTKEADNLHEECLVAIQIAFKEILAITAQKKESSILRDYIQGTTSSCPGLQFAKMKVGEKSWSALEKDEPFGVFHDKNIFLALYVMLMRVLIASACVDVTKESQQLKVLGDALVGIQPLMLYKAMPPLVSNMYLCVMKKVEPLGSSKIKEALGDACYDDFDAFFLLNGQRVGRRKEGKD